MSLMMYESEDVDPSLEENLRVNRLQLKFNWENIFRKYEDVEESGVEVDIRNFDVFAPDDIPKRDARRHAQKLETFGTQFGLAPMSAVNNDLDCLDGDVQLMQKCGRLDHEFRQVVRARVPHLQKLKRRSISSHHFPRYKRAKFVFRETVQEHEVHMRAHPKEGRASGECTSISETCPPEGNGDHSVIERQPSFDTESLENVLPSCQNGNDSAATSPVADTPRFPEVVSNNISRRTYVLRDVSFIPEWSPSTKAGFRKRYLCLNEAPLSKKQKVDETVNADQLFIPPPLDRRTRSLASGNKLFSELSSETSDGCLGDCMSQDSWWNSLCDPQFLSSMEDHAKCETFLGCPKDDVKKLLFRPITYLEVWNHFAACTKEEGFSVDDCADYARKEERRLFSQAKQRNTHMSHGYVN